MIDSVYQDAFNLLCGEKIGEGIHREVFECKIRPDLVVKVENSDFRYFANVMEQKFWDDHSSCEKISKWLAPCEYLSPDGRILLQRRAQPARREDLPEKLPAFLCDTKIANYGIIDGRLVCVDYGMFLTSASARLVKANWW